VSGHASAGRPTRLGTIAVLAVWAGVVTRVYSEGLDRELAPWFVGGLALFLAVHLFVLWRPGLSAVSLHVAFALQAALVLVLLSLAPDLDILTALLSLECYQAAVAFTGRVRLAWVAGLVTLIPVSLVLGPDWLDGLSVAFVPMAAGVILAMFAIVSRALEDARFESQGMVAELSEVHGRLEAYAGQVEELAAIDERTRVAGRLDASVATMLAEAVAVARRARGAGGEPQAVRPLLERLQELAQQALAQMRGVIAELRPPSGEAAADVRAVTGSPERAGS